MTDNWKQQLQRKMDSLERPAPELSWTELDKALKARADKAQAKKATTVPLWTRRIASAAAVALIVITGARLLPTNHEGGNGTEKATAEKAIALKATGEKAIALKETGEKAIALKEKGEKAIALKETGEKATGEESAKKPRTDGQDYRYMALAEQPYDTGKRNAHNGLKADLHVQGLMGANSTAGRTGTMGFMMSSAPTYGNGDMQMQGFAYQLMTTQRRDLSYDHDLPIKVGVSLYYDIDGRWSIVTGVNYSYLHSTFTVNDNPDHTGMQKLHYIGIPLAASLNVWKNDQMKLYVTAGATAEKLLKGSMSEKSPTGDSEDTRLSESRLQWSMQGALGMEYSITPTLGIYLEPGISHHFDNHSDIQNIYKDKPWNFSLNFGLRVNLK